VVVSASQSVWNFYIGQFHHKHFLVNLNIYGLTRTHYMKAVKEQNFRDLRHFLEIFILLAPFSYV